MGRRMGGRTDGRADGQENGREDGQVGGRTWWEDGQPGRRTGQEDGWMDGREDGWKDRRSGRMDGQEDGRGDRWAGGQTEGGREGRWGGRTAGQRHLELRITGRQARRPGSQSQRSSRQQTRRPGRCRAPAPPPAPNTAWPGLGAHRRRALGSNGRSRVLWLTAGPGTRVLPAKPLPSDAVWGQSRESHGGQSLADADLSLRPHSQESVGAVVVTG